jgi:diketogulonate reductase-like aldo/keto reductase
MAVPMLTLNDGNQIPQLALGLWKVADDKTFNTMFDAAVQAGYRHFDSAQAYDNEQLLGDAIRRHGLKRDELFITTKIHPRNYGHQRGAESFAVSLQNLQMEYVDLLLVHFPMPIFRKATWQVLENAQQQGQVRSIGVSNYMIRHLKSIKRYSGITPAVNQIELHVLLQQPELVEYCQEQGIVLEAYSPLAHGRAQDNAEIKRIAEKHGKSYAQVMIRWCLQQPAVVLPKSVTPKRLAENIDVFDFELDAQDMKDLRQEDRNLWTCVPTKPARYLP